MGRLIDADDLEMYVYREVALYYNVDEPVIIDAILKQPTVDAAAVVHGHWIEKPYLIGTSNFCSECGDNFGMPHGKYNYCPTCGAVMDEEE
jgi:hypothetical protein